MDQYYFHLGNDEKSSNYRNILGEGMELSNDTINLSENKNKEISPIEFKKCVCRTIKKNISSEEPDADRESSRIASLIVGAGFIPAIIMIFLAFRFLPSVMDFLRNALGGK